MLDDHKVEPSFFRYYSTKIGQQIFIEEDPNYKCSQYKQGDYNVSLKEKSTRTRQSILGSDGMMTN